MTETEAIKADLAGTCVFAICVMALVAFKAPAIVVLAAMLFCSAFGASLLSHVADRARQRALETVLMLCSLVFGIAGYIMLLLTAALVVMV